MVDITNLPDAPERAAIASNLDETFLVEAAAGTGKTTSMVTRMTALICEQKAEVPKIAAITFTRKAAAHLRQKFQNALEKAHSSEKDLLKKNLLASALEQFDRCYIGTIHSFCAQLLRERPVEAGVDPEFKEMEEADDALQRDACWHDYTQGLFINESPLFAEMERLGINFDNLKATYDVLCRYPDVVPAIIRMPKPDFAACLPLVEQFLSAAELKVPAEAPANGRDKLQDVLMKAIRLRRVLDLRDETEFVRLLAVLDSSGGITQNRWPDKDTAKEMQAKFEDFKDAVVTPMLQQWREHLHPTLINAVLPAVESYNRYRKTNGLLNFQDLLMMARDLLRDHPHIRRYFRERYTHLLVDEFQDTDPIQAELILYLTGDDCNETDWRRIRPVPGALFVVGDPKQSIYRFRRADITTYNRVREIIERSGGRVLKLSTNFRSAESICLHVNASFEDLFPNEATEEQAAHVPLRPVRLDADDISGVFKLEFDSSKIKNILGVSRVYDTQKFQADSITIAEWISNALRSKLQITVEDVKRPVTPGDFLIVLRNKKHLSEYTKALEARGIPFEVTGGGAFSQSQEIGMLIPFLKSIIDPDDALSQLAYLRGPLCGASDTALYEFKRSGGQFLFTADPPAGTDPRIVQAFGLLREAREWSRTLPPAAALSRIFERLGLIPYAASQEFGDTRGGNLLKLLAIARNFSAQGKSIAEIILQIEEMMNGSDIEEMGIEPGRADAVRLMNLHRSKGLEAPIVFLAGPVDGKDHAPEYFVDRSVDPPTGHFLITEPNGEHSSREIARPVDWDTKAEAERLFQQAEEERLLYVAATRPMSTLVISLFTNDTEAKGPWTELAAFASRNLPEIASPDEDADAPENAADLAMDFAQVREGVHSRLAQAREPGYAVTHVTKVAHRQDTHVFAEVRGHGTAWGRVLHGCLESLMRGDQADVRLLLENLMHQEEMPVDELDAIARLVESVQASELWQRACASEKCLVEVPFSLQVKSAELGIEDGPEECTLNGIIDLVFRENGEWIIVDYKSDVVGSRLSSLIDSYRPQVACYKRYWEQITNEPARAVLYFIDSGYVEWI